MLAAMELRQLRYFVAVAEEGNISRAAQKIFLTQPALSRQIQALEHELGQCLFERRAHSIQLTQAGEALLHEARELLQRADGIFERVRTEGQRVRLRVGYAPSLANGVLSGAIESFAQKHSNAQVDLFDLSTKEMLAGLENGTLDAAVTVGLNRDAYGLKWTPLVEVSWRLAVNRHHPLARQSRVTPVEVALGPLLVFCKRDYPEYWDFISGWLREHRQRPMIAGEYDGVNSLLAAVEAGLGIALVATSAARLVPKRVRMKDLSSAPKPLCIAVGHRASVAAAKPLRVFVEELRHACKVFANPGSATRSRPQADSKI